MLTKQEHHLLKSLDGWLGEALKYHIEAYSVLHALMEKHEKLHQECGAVDVAHTFTGSTVMALQLIKWQTQSVIADHEGILNRVVSGEEAKAHDAELANELTGIFQGWIGVNQALMGLHYAYTHIGHEIPLTAPPVSIEMEAGAGRPTVVKNDMAPTEGPDAPKDPGDAPADERALRIVPN